MRIGGENGGENGGGNGTLDKGGGNRGTVGMEVWEGSLHYLDEITGIYLANPYYYLCDS